MEENPNPVPVFSPIVFNNCKTLEQPTGSTYILSRPDLYGQVVAASITESRKFTVEKQKESTHTNISHKSVQTSDFMVDELPQCHGRCTMDLPPSGDDSLHRQFPGGLGGASGLGENSREMASGIPLDPHKYKGDDGCLENTTAFRTENNAQEYNDSHRQHIVCKLPQQIQRNQITFPTRSHSQNSDLVSTERNSNQSKTHTGPFQCYLRQSVENGPDSDHRMVHSPISDSPNNTNLGTTNDRPFCNKVQSQSSNLFQPNSRSTSPRNRCHVTELVTHDRLCISSSSSANSNPTKNQTGTMYSISGSSSMAVKVMVSNTTKPSVRQPTENHTKEKTPKTTIQQHLSPKPRCFTTPRLALIKQHLKTQGFSQQTANSITKRCRPTTNKLYETKWQIFTRWCHREKINPLKITKQQLANFFSYLHDDLHKGHSAILGYKAVINSTIKLCKSRDICNNYHLESLLRSYKLEKPSTDKTIPKWNLNLVLNSLTKKPYEPMLSCSLKHLTWKTAFLVSFATAARVSELAALNRNKVSHDRSWSKVSLQTHDTFVAKNQDVSKEPNARIYNIPALYDFAGPDLPDRHLCPIRCLRFYLHKTDYIRSPEKKALFISHSAKHKGDITANTIANWLKNVIKLAYENAGQDDLKIAKVTAHEVRALAASSAFKFNQSLQSINNACYWRGHSTFTNFYLRDLAMEQNHELHMPNVIAASTKIITRK